MWNTNRTDFCRFISTCVDLFKNVTVVLPNKETEKVDVLSQQSDAYIQPTHVDLYRFVLVRVDLYRLILTYLNYVKFGVGIHLVLLYTVIIR